MEAYWYALSVVAFGYGVALVFVAIAWGAVTIVRKINNRKGLENKTIFELDAEFMLQNQFSIEEKVNKGRIFSLKYWDETGEKSEEILKKIRLAKS